MQIVEKVICCSKIYSTKKTLFYLRVMTGHYDFDVVNYYF